MSNGSKIEWTGTTWNPTTGCSKISPGCKNCYACPLSARLQAMGQMKYRNRFALTLHPEELDRPTRWRKPRLIFVNSMSDIFHRDVPLDFIQGIFQSMAATPQHTYQVLTKRAERLHELAPQLTWTDNIWQGVSVENQDYVSRIDFLRFVPARVRFLSLEPLLGPLSNLNLKGIHWVIVGGESGPGARPIQVAWIQDIRDQCIAAGVPFFFKQWGGVNKKETGRILDGRIWNGMPLDPGARSRRTFPWDYRPPKWAG